MLPRTIKTPDGGVYDLREAETPTSPTNGWRVLHDLEIDGNWRVGMPEVFRLDPVHQMPFNEAWQQISYDMNTPLNPLVNVPMDKNKWRRMVTPKPL
jgi:hypothetical protein